MNNFKPVRAGKQHDERGAVLVLMAGSVIALMLVGALAIDFSYWVVHKRQLQNAAEAAALAGVAYLPDESAAKAKAIQIARFNGFSSPNYTVVPEVKSANILSVKITNNNTPTFLSAIALGKFVTTSGEAAAAIGKPPALGSPSNHLGTGPFFADAGSPSPQENSFLGINGACWDSSFGDRISSKISWNDIAVGSLKPSTPQWPEYESDRKPYFGCEDGLPNYVGAHRDLIDHEFTDLNPDFDPDGYFYIIDVPLNHPNPIDVAIYDPAFVGHDASGAAAARAFCGSSAPKISFTCDHAEPYCSVRVALTLTPGFVAGDQTCPTDARYTSKFRTKFTLYNPSTSPADPLGGTVKAEDNYYDGEQPHNRVTLNTAKGPTDWARLATIDSSDPAGMYVLQVQTDACNFSAPTCVDTWERPDIGKDYRLGSNAFSILAHDTSKGNEIDDCNTMTNSSCANVFGYDNFAPIFNNPANPSGETVAQFYLVNLPQEYAGRRVELSVFDPADGMNSLEILRPEGSNNWVPITDSEWSPEYSDGSTTLAENCTPTSPSPPCNYWRPASPLKVALNGDQNNGRGISVSPNASSWSTYNNKYLKLRFTLPGSYAPDAGNSWFKVRYSAPMNKAVQEYSTWSIKTVGTPVRLLTK